MSLFERLNQKPSLKATATQTGVPAPILKKVYDRGVEDAKDVAPGADKDAWGRARVASFVRGGKDRAKDSDLWQRYHDEPATEQREPATPVPLPGADVLNKHTGVFISLPDSLARYFPKKADDPSPPHLTLLYVGEITADEEKKLVEAVRQVAGRWPPFRVDVAAYGEFQNKEGQTIAHMVPSATICLSAENEIFRGLADLHADLYAAVEDAGVEVKHNYRGEKYGDHSDRVEAFRPHATLSYVPAGESYDGPRPTGSWHVTDLEVWGHDKYRLSLGMRPDWVPALKAIEPVPDEEPVGVEIEVQVEAVQVSPTTPLPPVDEVDLDDLTDVSAPSDESALVQLQSEQVTVRPDDQSFQAAAFRALGVSSAASEAEVRPPQENSTPPVRAAGLREPVKTPAEAPVETPAATERRPTWSPVRIFESFGYLDGSVLDFGGDEDHEYARYDVTSEDHDTANRRWKTIVCGRLHEQTPFGRTATLLALRGLLRRDGKALIALPVGQSVEEWEGVFGRYFSTKRLSVKGALAWQLAPTKEFVEQDQPEQVPAPLVLPPINLPPINLGPVIIKIPERQVQVVAPIHLTVPEQAPPQVNIAAGAVKVDVHTPQPPSGKKRVVMHKDAAGRVTGELEVIEDRPPALPEFPDVHEILNAPDDQPL